MGLEIRTFYKPQARSETGRTCGLTCQNVVDHRVFVSLIVLVVGADRRRGRLGRVGVVSGVSGVSSRLVLLVQGLGWRLKQRLTREMFGRVRALTGLIGRSQWGNAGRTVRPEYVHRLVGGQRVRLTVGQAKLGYGTGLLAQRVERALKPKIVQCGQETPLKDLPCADSAPILCGERAER